VKEPELKRPFRVPGAQPGRTDRRLPVLLLGISVFHSESERILGVNGLLFGVLLILAGFVAYWAQSAAGVELALLRRRRHSQVLSSS